MFALLTYLLKHVLLWRRGWKIKGEPVLQHLTNIDAFDIEDATPSFKLRCVKRVLAFCFLSPYFWNKCWEKCEERLTSKICRINVTQQSVLFQEYVITAFSQNTFRLLILHNYSKFTTSKTSTALVCC